MRRTSDNRAKKFCHEKVIGILLFILYLVISIGTLSDYGFTWDEVPYHTDIAKGNIEFLKGNPSLLYSHPHYKFYGPLPSIISYVSMSLLHSYIGMFEPDFAYHLPLVIMGSLTLLIVFFFALELFGLNIAVFSFLTLAFMPRFFGHIHNNVKDVPLAFFYTLAIWLFWKGYTQDKKYFIILSGISAGIASSTRLNGVFVFIIIVAWILIDYFLKNNLSLKSLIFFVKNKSYIGYFFIIGLFSLIVSWPWLWLRPFSRLFETVRFFSTVDFSLAVKFMGKTFLHGAVPWYYYLVYLVITTPPVFLILFLFGLFFIFNNLKKENSGSYLIVIWFFIAFGKELLFGNTIISYDGIRHFLEAIPAFCIIVGIGLNSLYLFIKSQLSRSGYLKTILSSRVVFSLLLLIIFSAPLLQLIKFHPYQTVYYNSVVGGIKGAEGNFDLEYWGNSYKQGIIWANANLEPNSTLEVVFVQDELVRMYLDENINLVDENGDYVMYIIRHIDFFPYKIPVYELSVDGVPILKIVRMN